MKKWISFLLLGFAFVSLWQKALAQPTKWTKLNTEAYSGKQDDIFFLDENRGWYGNGKGRFYQTTNGGLTWQLQSEKIGTFWRCLAFLDSAHGFAGNVGTDYFPGVTDTIPLYETFDGGRNWKPAQAIKGGMPKGLCALFVQKTPFVNQGILAHKTTVWAAGRVGSPAWVMKSTDEGKSWSAQELNQTAMIFDLVMTDTKTGFICGASDADVSKAKPQVLKTTDAGKSWKIVYEGKTGYELTWKATFPTSKTGYVSIQSYNPDTSFKARYILKTTDEGQTWKELPLAENYALRQFGIGFINENHGFVGTTIGGFETKDGGLTWEKVTLGRAVNKFRFFKNGANKTLGFAIGADVFKME